MPGATPAGEEMLPRRFRVVDKKRETADTCTFTMVPVDGGQTFHFAPGQFNMIYLFGYGEVPISISGDPAAPDRLVHTARAVGSVTHGFTELATGDMVGVRGPFGSPWPLAAAEGEDVLVIAGGLGLAPLRSAIYQLIGARDRYRRITILHGARSPETILFNEELRQWRSHAEIRCELTVDFADAGWQGRVGVITQLIAQTDFDPRNAIVFMCGPEVMMRFAVEALKSRCVSEERIHVSMERSMKCALGHCGHCQLGPFFICKDGPVLRYDRIRAVFQTAEL